MKYELPNILAVGIFNSLQSMPDICDTKPRCVNSYELEYFYEDGGISVVNGIEYKIKKGNILLAKPGDIRYSHLPAQCRYIIFSADDKNLKNALDNIKRLSFIYDCKRIERAYDSIFEYHDSKNPMDNIAAAAECVLLLNMLSREGVARSDIISRAQKYIEANYQSDISNEDIAEASYVNVSYLYRMFKKVLNTTPGDYLTNCRLSAAKNLLINTDMSLVDIAYRCGFDSQSYFSYSFKKHMGLSPTEFKKSFTR